jgi:glycosyltransferase involved in cell wall biosynthesis
MITVFTPAYNRAHLLPRLFESLCKQTYKDFEWVIVDDGSVDDTKSLTLSLSNREGTWFPVRYFYQENGGKHRAINHGVKEARGELFLILDSDDTLPPNSLELINHYFQQIKDDMSFGGVCGYMAHHDGTIIGRGNDDKVLDANSIEMRYRYNIQGDMLEVFRTEVLREIPFPEIPGEKFVSEALTWNRIACKYKLRVFHEVVYYRDYLDGGLTDKIIKIRMTSPIASMMTYAELNSYEIPFVSKVKTAINYWRFRLCAHNMKGTQISQIPQINDNYPKLKWWWNWTMPIGWAMHVKDVNNKKTQ